MLPKKLYGEGPCWETTCETDLSHQARELYLPNEPELEPLDLRASNLPANLPTRLLKMRERAKMGKLPLNAPALKILPVVSRALLGPAMLLANPRPAALP
eukprot:8623838-Heterocapsa_arctica.AAC.1